jgi:hypothetical protein
MSINPCRYNRLYLSLLGFAALGVSTHPVGATDKLDLLVPINGIIKPAFLGLLRRNLYLTPAEYTRIVILPSTGSLGETVYSLRSDKENGNGAILTRTHAQTNLWAEASDANGRLTIEPQAKILRSDISVPKSLAISISSTIGKMIEARRDWTGTGPIIVDGTDFLFTIERAGRQHQAVLMAGSTGKRAKTLIRLLEALDRYCKANSRDRSRFLSAVEIEAKLLANE